MGKITNILVHPVFVAAAITLLILWITPPLFNRYEVKLLSRTHHNPGDQVRFFYHDFDHDGTSEKIHVGLNGFSRVPFIDYFDTSGVLVDEWNCPGQWVRHAPLLFGDCNANGYDEVYGFTLLNDSLFLNGVELFSGKDFEVRNMFIEHIPKYEDEYVVRVVNGAVRDLDGDGYPEPVFCLNGGFAPQPRGVYAANIRKDTVIRSPFMGAAINSIRFADVDRDGLDEIAVNTASSNNCKTPVPWTDTCSWAMVLDNDLSFLFPPVMLEGKFGGAANLFLQRDGKWHVLAQHNSFNTRPPVSRLLLFDLDGSLVRESDLDMRFRGINMIAAPRSTGQNPFFIYQHGLYPVDEELTPRWGGRIKLPVGNLRMDADLDQDGIPEMIFASADQTSIVIYRDGFRHPVVLDQAPYVFMTVTARQKSDDPGLFCINDDQSTTWYLYSRNALYALRYPSYAAAFLILWGFFHFLLLAQKKRINKQYETERKIYELQMLTIRNQMNPHFTFNALNSIGSVVYKEDKTTAYNFFTKFSNLIRFTLKNAEHITVPLAEELEFVSNYLDLEKFRFKDRFEYKIEVGPGVDHDIEVPRMILQTFAENAVKHGLGHLEKGGMLKIEVARNPRTLVMVVEDNGVGRETASGQVTAGTGKGMHIAGQIFDLYHKLKGKRITHTVTDLKDDEGRAAGTRIEVKMEL